MDEKFYFFEDTRNFKSDVGTSVLSKKESQMILLLATNKLVTYKTIAKEIFNCDRMTQKVWVRLRVLKHRLQSKTGLKIEFAEHKGYYINSKINIATQFEIL